MYKSTKITTGGADSFPLFVGRNHIVLEVVESTNSYASELLSITKPPEGTAISAVNQVGGKGQIGNEWLTVPGKNITISYIFYPSFLSIKQQFYLNLAVAVACRSTLQGFLKKKVLVKWPNDLIVESRKIGGVLIQNNLQHQTIKSSIVGIGLNINQQSFEDLLAATSLSIESGKDFECRAIIEQLNAEIEKRYLSLRQGNLHNIAKEYYQFLYLLNQPAVFYLTNGSIFKGSICGVSVDGKLEVKEGKSTHTFGIKEVKFSPI